MKKQTTAILSILYTTWCAFWFLAIMLLFMPFFLLLSAQKARSTFWVSKLKKTWARICLFLWAIPVKITYETPLSKKRTYIFCANHTSLVDIVVMGSFMPANFIFIGKEELNHVPIFGYVFKKFHVPVKRSNHLNSYQAMLKTAHAIDLGRSPIIFPEGGIVTTNPPKMARFKDGAFRLAIEKKIPIVPVTLLFNWIVLPDEQYIAHRHPIEIIVHAPIETEFLSIDELDAIKQQAYNTINEPLIPYQKPTIKQKAETYEQSR
ncbi:MAG: 1-acyl-sn-glycerol-3-phosphate acyltransferase [Cytophagales bacterium]|nr:MAG: 1-acyl-sn-glycerol-3-phosphate acyltransferase [Cytophagales bacterium]